MITSWSTDEAVRRLGSPALHDDITGLVHITGEETSAVAIPATFRGIVVAEADPASPLGRSVDASGEPGELVAVVESNPQAATTLAQLLRSVAMLGTEEALVAESLAYATLQAGGEFATWLAGRGRRSRPAEAEPAVVVTEREHSVLVELNRPRLQNAFDARMRNELRETLAALCVDERAVELAGRGRSFCIGGDLAEFGMASDPSSAHQLRMAGNVAPLLARLADRLTVRVHGASIGAGVELAAFAGHVEASPDATFRLPEVSMGLIPGAGGTVSIPRRIGRQRTLWLALSDTTIDASTALAWGLVDDVSSSATQKAWV